MLRERLKGVVIGVVLTLLLVVSVHAFAKAITTSIQVTYRNIGVSVDGKKIVTEQEPFIFEGRTYLAVRDISDAFGAEIRMNETSNTVEITSHQTTQTSAATPQTPAKTSVSATDRSNRPSNPAITREAAEGIALGWFKTEGITGAQRDGGTSMDYEQGCWVWEASYKTRTHEYEFYIDVNTGEVVKVDSERD